MHLQYIDCLAECYLFTNSDWKVRMSGLLRALSLMADTSKSQTISDCSVCIRVRPVCQHQQLENYKQWALHRARWLVKVTCKVICISDPRSPRPLGKSIWLASLPTAHKPTYSTAPCSHPNRSEMLPSAPWSQRARQWLRPQLLEMKSAPSVNCAGWGTEGGNPPQLKKNKRMLCCRQ